MLTYCNVHYADAIDMLEMLYFTQAQKDDERREREKLINDPDAYLLAKRNLTPDEWQRLESQRLARRVAKCLTMSTYRKILRLKGGAKK